MPWTEQLRPNRKPKTEWRQLREKKRRGGCRETESRAKQRGRVSAERGREQNGINWSWSGALHSEEAGFAYLCSGAEGEMCRCWQQAEYLKPPLTPLQALSPHKHWYTVEGTHSSTHTYLHTHTHTDLRSGDGKLCALLCSCTVMYSSACCLAVSLRLVLRGAEPARPAISAATQQHNYSYVHVCIWRGMYAIEHKISGKETRCTLSTFAPYSLVDKYCITLLSDSTATHLTLHWAMSRIRIRLLYWEKVNLIKAI